MPEKYDIYSKIFYRDVEKFVRHLCLLVLGHQMRVSNYFVNSFYSVMYLPASKTFRAGPYKSQVHEQLILMFSMCYFPSRLPCMICSLMLIVFLHLCFLSVVFARPVFFVRTTQIRATRDTVSYYYAFSGG
jgi:hypothetical protein